MNLTPFLPAGFFLCSQLFSQDTLTIGLMATMTKGNCPLCQTTASRVHSFYQRTLADLPMSGKRIKLLIRLRKFFCPQISCPRKVFAQSFNLVFKPYPRRLLRANQQIQDIDLFTGAKPAARLCHLIGQCFNRSARYKKNIIAHSRNTKTIRY